MRRTLYPGKPRGRHTSGIQGIGFVQSGGSNGAWPTPWVSMLGTTLPSTETCFAWGRYLVGIRSRFLSPKQPQHPMPFGQDATLRRSPGKAINKLEVHYL